MKKIFILGTVGSGKSTLANQLSEKLRINHYDLDDVFWENKFNKKRSEQEREKEFNKIINKDSWIIEGVYTAWIEEGIKKSDLVILLKVPLSTLASRITKRSIKNKGESFKGYAGMLKAARNYYKKTHKRGYFKHKELVGKHNINFIMLRKGKEIKEFIEEI
jgi:adenylate kinase family enzyme